MKRGQGPALFDLAPVPTDKHSACPYMRSMRTLYVAVPLIALLAFSVWFAAVAWERLGGEAIPAYGYVAIGGGVFFSLLVGGGLMALVFYSNRHGYDDLSSGDKDRR